MLAYLRILSGLAGTLCLATVLLASPAAAVESNEGLIQRADRSVCFEVRDGSFLVRECLHLERSRAVQPGMMALPESLLATLGQELLWAEPMLSQLNGVERARGHYQRTAELDGEETSLGTEEFVVRRSGDADSVHLDLRLRGHAIRSVEVRYFADGTGSVIFRYRAGMEHTFLFEDGQPLQELTPLVEKASSFYMGCYIDTPAFDQYRPDACWAFGWEPTIAVFKVFLPYTPSAVVWYDPSSTCSWLTCSTTISPGQIRTGYAYWVINGIPTGPVGATAGYHSWD